MRLERARAHCERLRGVIERCVECDAVSVLLAVVRQSCNVVSVFVALARVRV
jgi:DNA-binding FrmR family transcriptional regulator